MMYRPSIIGEEIIADVRIKAALASSEAEIGSLVLDALCERFVDPRAIPLEDVKTLLCHAVSAYRQEEYCAGHVAV